MKLQVIQNAFGPVFVGAMCCHFDMPPRVLVRFQLRLDEPFRAKDPVRIPFEPFSLPAIASSRVGNPGVDCYTPETPGVPPKRHPTIVDTSFDWAMGAGLPLNIAPRNAAVRVGWLEFSRSVLL